MTAPLGADVDRTEMAPDKLRLMATVEEDHWWFRAKRELVSEVLAGAGVRGPVIDVGCGTGAVIRRLAADGIAPVFGTDLSPIALAAARGGTAPLLRSLAEHLPFRSGTFEAIVSLDVVEHLDDDVAGLVEYRRVVQPGGLVVLAVPAYQWAWSEHDVQLGHRRRYTRDRLRRAAEAAGLEVERATHFHAWLAPAAFLVRRTPVGRLLRGEQEEASYVGPRANRALSSMAAGERRVARRWAIPVGLSILLVARRPADGET